MLGNGRREPDPTHTRACPHLCGPQRQSVVRMREAHHPGTRLSVAPPTHTPTCTHALTCVFRSASAWCACVRPITPTPTSVWPPPHIQPHACMPSPVWSAAQCQRVVRMCEAHHPDTRLSVAPPTHTPTCTHALTCVVRSASAWCACVRPITPAPASVWPIFDLAAATARGRTAAEENTADTAPISMGSGGVGWGGS